MKFIDEARIFVQSGNGGAGCASFHREKFVPRGGPDGGDGGDGGSVIFEATTRLSTLMDFRYQSHYEAPNGAAGSSKKKYGAAGADLIIPVPVGTQILDEKGVCLCDLTWPDQQYVAAEGGRGGRGNARFATSTRQAPDHAQPGEEGSELWLNLELQVLADVGLLGFPNAGKSTLIRNISNATPRVEDYPFTTLVPNLGVVAHYSRRFVVADLPGLIEGAHAGRGLGDRFLKHLSRTRVLAYVLAVQGEHPPLESFLKLRQEVLKYDADLMNRPIVIVFSKCDLLTEGSEWEAEAAEQENKVRAQLASENISATIVRTSGITGMGMPPLLDALTSALEEAGMWRDVQVAPKTSFHPLDSKKDS
ncbi:MAG: GTPase ObgE [Myxococcales bacterium]|nr:GTPase ObgE [Myxococcales bacterium]|tara:strand:- start:573 stop:1661 length:1089 start_codon:yes stop_codon:yes gene_type:complete